MCLFQIHEIYTLQCFKLLHFSKKSGGLSSAGAEFKRSLAIARTLLTDFGLLYIKF